MDNLGIRLVFEDANRKVEALESRRAYRIDDGDGLHAIGTARPIAIVVTTRDRRYAIDMQARPVDLDDLVNRHPGFGSAASGGSDDE